MSGYILCHEKKAARPYYIEAVGIRIWTIEELCYYVSKAMCGCWTGALFLRGSVRLGGQAASGCLRLAKLLYAEYYRGKSLRNFMGDPADQHRVLHPGGDRTADPVSGRHGACVGDGAAETEKAIIFLGDRKYRRAIGMYNQMPGDAQKPGADRVIFTEMCGTIRGWPTPPCTCLMRRFPV